MKVRIDIANDIVEQLSEQLTAYRAPEVLKIDPSVGQGNIYIKDFPNTLAFYHLFFSLKNKQELTCLNAATSDYFLLKINLSERAIEKEVNGQAIEVQKVLPSGIVYYPPNTKVTTNSPANSAFDVVLIKFHKRLLSTYFDHGEHTFLNIKDTTIYEALDFKSEELLRKTTSSTNKMKSHAHLIEFLAIFFDKLRRRVTDLKYINLHPEDNKQLFLAASQLRNPIATKVPTIEDLSTTANMGKTKFKKSFKEVFGSAPKQYHQKIKMEYAMAELQKKQKTSTEIAYELGYSHPSKFTRAFKKYFGTPPSKVV
ncbi:MAG: AraC family transcriptional regulator [Bacteroidota bacterium]